MRSRLDATGWRRLRLQLKWALFPGLDLLTRCRFRFLPTFFKSGALTTLDAGCGNGALSYAAYKRGNTVLGITSNPREVLRNRELFSANGMGSGSLSFVQLNLYQLPSIAKRFDQIICSETLEHVTRDELILRYFNDALKQDGILHLCCPYALHPLNKHGRISEPEDGRHVRDGYTLESYTALLSRTGFEIVQSAGLGGPLVVRLEQAVGWIRSRFGDGAALPFFLVALPLSWLDRMNPQVPFSLYVQAVKRHSLDGSDVSRASAR